MTIIAAADGSALGNPGPAGWAWFIDEDTWAAGGWPHGTNNQGELMAVIDLLESTAGEPDDLRILCDSQYVINAVTKWMPGWKRKGWRKADGAPVQNRDLLTRLDAALVGRDYRFEWVRGHAGHELNEAADDRARGAATAYQRGTAVERGPGWRSAGVHDAPPVPRTAQTADPVETGSPLLLQPGLFDDDLVVEETQTDVVVRLERELLEAAVRSDPARIAALLHPDFEEIGRAGLLWGRDTVIEELAAASSPATTFDVLGVDRLNEDTVLLTARSADASGTTLRSSLWVRVAGSWRLRFHQGTPAE